HDRHLPGARATGAAHRRGHLGVLLASAGTQHRLRHGSDRLLRERDPTGRAHPTRPAGCGGRRQTVPRCEQGHPEAGHHTTVRGGTDMSGETNYPMQSFGGLRYEVIPLRGALAAARDLPSASTVTVTSTPTKGLDATIDMAERLQLEGYHAVPHLAARLLASRAQLDELLEQLAECDVSEVFVIGG